jgi:hypothetical protein
MRNKVPAIRIFTIRDQKVVLESDLASVYGVPTKVLNQAFRRARSRFPRFRVSVIWGRVRCGAVTNCDRIPSFAAYALRKWDSIAAKHPLSAVGIDNESKSW